MTIGTHINQCTQMGLEHTAFHVTVSVRFQDDYEDLAAAAVRRCEPTSHVGLWPGFSFFNHSCLPNTVHYVVGDAMVVRTTNDINKGVQPSQQQMLLSCISNSQVAWRIQTVQLAATCCRS